MLGAEPDRLDLVPAQASLRTDPLVLGKLVGAVGAPGDPQDKQLAVARADPRLIEEAGVDRPPRDRHPGMVTKQAKDARQGRRAWGVGEVAIGAGELAAHLLD